MTTPTTRPVAPQPPAAPVLTGRNLVRRFGTTTAVAGVDLDLHGGEVLAVMGPSGSGKTTLLHLLAAIARPDDGEVWLEGRRIDDLSESRRTALRRRRFGFVFQSHQLLPELPAVENVALPLIVEGMTRHRAVRHAAKWFEPLGIDGLEKRRPGELSGGQAQRVAIARALVTSPAVIFADEPTAALDRATGASTMAVLAGLARQMGTGVLIVTHDHDVLDVCDTMVSISDGRIVGEHRRLPGGGPGAPTMATTAVVGPGAASAPVAPPATAVAAFGGGPQPEPVPTTVAAYDGPVGR